MPMGAASDCAHHPYLSLYLPHNQAHYGVDEDEEWWPGLVLGVHSQGAHTVASTTTASSSSNANRNPFKLTLTLILTRTLTRILTLTRRARAL